MGVAASAEEFDDGSRNRTCLMLSKCHKSTSFAVSAAEKKKKKLHNSSHIRLIRRPMKEIYFLL
jgi:hypothetical protein